MGWAGKGWNGLGWAKMGSDGDIKELPDPSLSALLSTPPHRPSSFLLRRAPCTSPLHSSTAHLHCTKVERTAPKMDVDATSSADHVVEMRGSGVRSGGCNLIARGGIR